MTWGAILVASGLMGCDKDPSSPRVDFRLAACPTGPLSVNSPITLAFTQPLLATSVNGANVVVSDATTGLEIPGAVAISGTNPSQIAFASERPLTFGRAVRIRVQNIRSATGNASAAVMVCDVAVEPPFITQLYWNYLPQPTGTSITGVSLIAPDRGFVTARGGPVFRRDTSDFVVAFSAPNLEAPNDVAFATRTHGLVAYTDVRNVIWRILESQDGGLTFDTIAVAPGNQAIRRVIFRSTGPNLTDRFGIIAGGTSVNALFGKYDPVAKTFAYQSLPGGANIFDIDFASDNQRGVAVATGVKIGSFFSPGEVFVTSNGGTTWTRVTNATANSIALGYRGVAMRENGEIFVAGFSGYLLKLTPAGAGAYTITRIGQNLITNPDSTNPNALIHTDVEFVRGQDTRGWLVGKQQVGIVNGTPRYQGYIFETNDGGVTWVRQGVAGAANFGAEMPALARISVLSANSAWIGAEDGSVLDLKHP